MLLGVAPDVVTQGAAYMRIQLVGIVTMGAITAGQGIMNASGDTRTPMKISLSYRILHIGLAPCLIFGLGIFPKLGVQGAALSSVISQAVGGGIAMWILFSGTDAAPGHLEGLWLRPKHHLAHTEGRISGFHHPDRKKLFRPGPGAVHHSFRHIRGGGALGLPENRPVRADAMRLDRDFGRRAGGSEPRRQTAGPGEPDRMDRGGTGHGIRPALFGRNMVLGRTADPDLQFAAGRGRFRQCIPAHTNSRIPVCGEG